MRLSRSVFLLVAVIIACTTGPKRQTGLTFSEARMPAQSSAADYYPYPDASRNLVKLGTLDLFNTNLTDFSSSIRNQGAIGSCASHGMIGLVENQMFLDRGITLDLSERFLMYSNFMAAGNIGSKPATIAEFPNIIRNWGLMPEASYPYAAVAANSAAFEQDAAQNLKGDATVVSVDKAISETSTASQKRHEILQEARYFGKLPSGDFPVALPMRVQKLAKNARVPEFEDRRVPGQPKIISCFTDRSEPAQITVTPREFADLCVDFNPKSYFSCNIGLEAVMTKNFSDQDETQICRNAARVADDVAKVQNEKGKSLLALTIALLDRGQASSIGVQAPATGGPLSVWSSRLKGNAGHAVLILGSLTFAELQNPEEHKKGLLADGSFDRLAVSYDQLLKRFGQLSGEAYQVDPNATLETKMRKRIDSSIGKIMAKEGGLLLFRNSWGDQVGEIEIGARGYQAMTFEYFLKNTWMMSSRRQKSLPQIPWQDGPVSCPLDSFDLASGDSWIKNADFRGELRETVAATLKGVCSQ